jgi:O-methyltransferase
MISVKQLIRRAVTAAVRSFGFDLRRRNDYEYIGHIPDRFSYNREKYNNIGTAFSDQSVAAFLTGNSRNTYDLARFYFLAMACDLVEKEAVPGDVAELGVYKGNTAFLLAELARRTGRIAYLFDTFKSLPTRDLIGIDSRYHDRKSDFLDTSVDAVRRLVGSSNVELIVGYFPDSVTNASATTRYALVHLDCDLYAPMHAGLEFFYPKLVPGGFLIIHDYMSLYWDGVEKAINEFFADKPERFIPIPDKSGTIAIRKH